MFNDDIQGIHRNDCFEKLEKLFEVKAAEPSAVETLSWSQMMFTNKMFDDKVSFCDIWIHLTKSQPQSFSFSVHEDEDWRLDYVNRVFVFTVKFRLEKLC